jgi:hypothetical protein
MDLLVAFIVGVLVMGTTVAVRRHTNTAHRQGLQQWAKANGWGFQLKPEMFWAHRLPRGRRPGWRCAWRHSSTLPRAPEVQPSGHCINSRFVI